jgi:hypothetical protein
MEPANGRDPAKFSTREMIDTERGMVDSAERLASTGGMAFPARSRTPRLMARAPYRPSSKTPSGTFSSRAAWPWSSATPARANRSR